DLKPSNIKLTPEGRVKLLDFGLAKALEGEGDAVNLLDVTVSRAATRPGMLLGTPAYMSPEQARCATVDKRTDIWAFGCVFFEVPSGRKPFPAKTLSETLASILEREPEWNTLPGGTPEAVRTLIIRCLRKDPNRRLRDIGEARIILEELARGAPAPV